MDNSSVDKASLILRIGLGLLVLYYNSDIYVVKNIISGTYGMPTFIAYLVYVAKIVIPIFIILGLFTKVSAIILTTYMVILTFLYNDWGITEVSSLYILASSTLYFLGAGNISLDSLKKRRQ